MSREYMPTTFPENIWFIINSKRFNDHDPDWDMFFNRVCEQLLGGC